MVDVDFSPRPGIWASLASWRHTECPPPSQPLASRCWLHADDLPRFTNPSRLSGARLLPPYDAYLDQRDRATLLPDKARHRQVWAALGNAGVVPLDGEVAASWRAQKKGKRLTIAVEPFGPPAPQARAEIEAEAALLGPFRACTSVEVSFGG